MKLCPGGSYHLFPPPKALEELSFLGGRGRPLFGLGIFTFHSLPQIDGMCPVPDGDVLSSQAPTNTHHPGGENNKLFLGRICMSSPSCQTAVLWGRRGRWSRSIVLAWSKVSPALGTDL